MIRIRVGDAWKHDPGLRASLRSATRRAHAEAARRIVDVLALEVDGVDIAAGRTEGPLLPSLEALLRAVARIVSGTPQASVPFEGGDVELVLCRRGGSALLTVVAPGPPSRVLARDVEVDVEALAAAALEASAELCRDLAGVGPAVSRGTRRLRDAARRLRAAEVEPRARPRRPARRAGTPGPAAEAAGVGRRRPRGLAAVERPSSVSCSVELHDDEGLVEAYAGGRADLGSLLAPGVTTLTVGAVEAARLTAPPFLVVRDLAAAAARLARAAGAGEARFEAEIVHAGRGGVRLSLDLLHGTLAAGRGPKLPCPPLALARAALGAALDLAGALRARNPRQGENAYVVELEAAAAEGLARVDEMEEGDRVDAGAGGTSAPPPRPVPQEPLGPGHLRRLAFRRTVSLDVGAPSGQGLLACGALAVAAGAAGIAALDAASGAIAWRAGGCSFAAAVPGGVLAVRGTALECLGARTGRLRWTRALPGGAPRAALALARGPLVLVEAAALTGIDPGSGRTLWRFEPPAAARVAAATFGGLALVAADTGALYGLDAAGRPAFRIQAPGAILSAPAIAGRLALVAAEAGPVAAIPWSRRSPGTAGRCGRPRRRSPVRSRSRPPPAASCWRRTARAAS
ncbi:MAG TPA: PQQ-binding-like beta-propeller repeat protein, partial [Anaeromyxobacteraceae bacterium]|nr:PQQ-binding-like beta-propeller repeat protein [Anaeromyxobacteraceae bacterium]